MKARVLRRPIRMAGLFTIFALAASLSGCGSTSGTRLGTEPNIGLDDTQVYSTQTRSIIGVEALYRALRKADYILLGEVHEDPQHHELQRLLLHEIVRDGRRPAVVFEMFDRREAKVIASSVQRSPRDPDAIAAAVRWSKSGRPAWRLYRPIVDTALAAGLPIEAGNISRTTLSDIVIVNGWHGIDRHILNAYGMPNLLPEDAERRLRNSLLITYGKAPRQVVTNMLREQRLRQASLADAMLTGNPGDGAVLIAGREFVRLDYGVPRYLRFREPETEIASVAFVDTAEFDPDAMSADGTTPRHDYIWLLPSSTAGRVMRR